jgi:dCMP deaminase
MMVRKSWDKYFMDIAKDVATRATCLRRQIGAIIVKNKRILTTGYNGAIHRYTHCIDVGKCLKGDAPSGTGHEICNAVHAEMNAIIQAARFGIPVENSEIYITTPPCSLCAKMIAQAGINKVIYIGDYPDKRALELLQGSGIEVVRLEED